MRELGRAADRETRVYFTGGATAVLMGWRESTIDADIRIVPESDAIFRAIPALKERLSINVDLPLRSNFIPELPGCQALAKIERGHDRDKGDVAALLTRGLIEPREAARAVRSDRPASRPLSGDRSAVVPPRRRGSPDGALTGASTCQRIRFKTNSRDRPSPLRLAAGSEGAERSG
jgi:hypothetical protein